MNRGRLVPGVYRALLARRRRLDATFCLRPLGGDCTICPGIVAMENGEPVQFSGDAIWSATFDDRVPNQWAEFCHDNSIYRVTPDDRIVTVSQGD